MEQSEDREFTEDRSETVQEAPPLVSCFWCERLHPGEHPLSVCPTCTAGSSTLRSLEMSGSFPLSDEAIDETLMRTSPGNYALGYMDGDAFVVFYVGRSDGDLRQRLHDWVGMPSRYERYASVAKAPWGVVSSRTASRGHSGIRPGGERREQLHALRLQLRALCRRGLRQGVAQLRRLRRRPRPRQRIRADLRGPCDRGPVREGSCRSGSLTCQTRRRRDAGSQRETP